MFAWVSGVASLGGPSYVPSAFLTGTKPYTHRYLGQTLPQEDDTIEDAILQAQQAAMGANGDNEAAEEAP